MQLIWFRQDLRIQDHMALWYARQQGPCVGLCILSPEQWQLHQDAPIKIELYLQRLSLLKLQLAELNIPLIVLNIPLWQDIPSSLVPLCQNLHVQSIHSHIEVGVNELARDQAVAHALTDMNVSFDQYDDRTLFPFGSIRNQSEQPYQVFTAFKKKCYERLILDVPRCLPTIEAQEKLDIDLSTYTFDFESLRHPELQNTIAQYWVSSDEQIQQRLDVFVDEQLKHYKIKRDIPSLDGTSQMSPYLNIGAISIRQCIHVLFIHSNGYFEFNNDGQQTWLDELLWREFYQHTLFDFPKLSKHQPFKDNTQQIQWRDAPEDLLAWQQGQTGIPIVDAGMRQLLATGWMHNRVRMIVAMFLNKNLLIDWRLGEAWFMQHLIDGDLAANNGGWQWCASTGMDAAPYFRIFNPISQSQRFDPNGDYIRQWVPELKQIDAKNIHEPYAKYPNLQLNYPKPIVDLKRSRLRAIEVFKLAS